MALKQPRNIFSSKRTASRPMARLELSSTGGETKRENYAPKKGFWGRTSPQPPTSGAVVRLPGETLSEKLTLSSRVIPEGTSSTALPGALSLPALHSQV